MPGKVGLTTPYFFSSHQIRQYITFFRGKLQQKYSAKVILTKIGIWFSNQHRITSSGKFFLIGSDQLYRKLFFVQLFTLSILRFGLSRVLTLITKALWLNDTKATLVYVKLSDMLE